MTEAAEFSRRINLLEAVAGSGREIALEPAPDERRSLARRFDLISLERMTVRLRCRPETQGGIGVAGQLSAEVVQRCVVSLEPLPATIMTTFDVVFLPSLPATAEVEDQFTAADPPEVLPTDGLVDLGEISAQFLGVAIDPYPRKPGAELPDQHMAPGDAAKDNPFAVLEALKTKGAGRP